VLKFQCFQQVFFSTDARCCERLPKSDAMSKDHDERPKRKVRLKDVPVSLPVLAKLRALRERVSGGKYSVAQDALALQEILHSLADRDLGAFHPNKEAVLLLNEIRDILHVDLFLDDGLVEQVSLSCIAPQPSFPNGRLDTKSSKPPQTKSYHKVFPRLYLGVSIHVPPWDSGRK
jgi:hypothetical protein